MKKLLVVAVALALALSLCAVAGAEEGYWYELSADDTVLTVTLPANPTTGYQWVDSVTDETVLEMITCEYTQDEGTENLLGAGGTFVASYRGIAEGTIALTFSYKRADDEDAEKVYSLILNVDAEGKIAIDAVITDAPSADEWMELDAENNTVTARLAANTAEGYFWTVQIGNPEVIELLADGYDDPDTATCAENLYIASFRVIGQSDEEQTIAFAYAKDTEDDTTMPIEIHVANLCINQDGQLEITGLTTETFVFFVAE